MKTRILHRRLGLGIAFFLLVQALAGMLMATGKLASLDSSKSYSLLYAVHADWDPLGSIYRIVLGVATAIQGILGISLFLGIARARRADRTREPHRQEKEAPMAALGFAADIRPLFRDKDVAAMKPMGMDLSSYEEVKKRAHDIYARLSAQSMPCDGGWDEARLRKLKEWIDGGMAK